MLRRNNTSYQVDLSRRLTKLYEDYKKYRDGNKVGITLMFHQFLIRDMFTNPLYGIGQPFNNRGLLIYHGLGAGKTLVTAATMLALLDVYIPILYVPKSLQTNFLNAIDQLVPDPQLADNIKSRLSFVTSDAFNSSAQIKARASSLNGKLLIVEEAHNFFKAVVNSTSETSNAKIIYNMIMSAVDVRILFLSGTPIVKDPFELAACINMLTGKETLPMDYENFYDIYVEDRTHLKNKEKLQNRLFGLISHVTFTKPLTPDSTGVEEVDFGLPKNLGISFDRVEMSETQYSRYLMIRDKEDRKAMELSKKSEERSKGKKKRETPAMTMPSAVSKGSSYYIESRQLSNFSLPLDEMDTKNYSKIDEKYFTKEASPKIDLLTDRLFKGKKPALIYSQFIASGLAVIVRYLEKKGAKQWTQVGDRALSGDAPVGSKPIWRFATISGGITPKDRDIIQQAFNDPENMYGEIIAFLLISESGAEGLDLKNIREVHILEPYWDYARIEQVIGRANRRGSHAALPDEERTVHSTVYVSGVNKKLKNRENETIDERFLRNALRKHKLNGEFLEAIREVCLECVTNHYDSNKKDIVNCRVCLPNNTPLFSESSPMADLREEDPCRPLSEKKDIEATKIKIGDEEFFYTKDSSSPLGYFIYQFKEELNGYVEIPLNNNKSIEIVTAIRRQTNK